DVWSVTVELANISQELANVSEELANVSKELANISQELANVSEELANVSEELANVSQELANSPTQASNMTARGKLNLLISFFVSTARPGSSSSYAEGAVRSAWMPSRGQSVNYICCMEPEVRNGPINNLNPELNW
uniref:Uncharacterized protein n=1 Tax=Xiphophorus couchianus TaxID=32473 RepID=A0A3B5MVX0_9TELE